MSSEQQGWGRAEEIAGRLAARCPSIQRGGASCSPGRRAALFEADQSRARNPSSARDTVPGACYTTYCCKLIDGVKCLKDSWTKHFKRLKDYWAKRLKNCWVQGLKNARLKDDRLRLLGGPQEAPRASRSPSRRPTRPHRAGRTQLSGDPSDNFPTHAGSLAPQLEDVHPDSGALLAGRLGIGGGTELSDFSRSCSPARASQRRSHGQNSRNRICPSPFRMTSPSFKAPAAASAGSPQPALRRRRL